MKHKKQRKPKIVRTANYNCAYVSIMAVLIIFRVILRTVINLIMLSGEEREKQKMNGSVTVCRKATFSLTSALTV